MNGFREELVSSLSGINGDITVYEADEKDLLKLKDSKAITKIDIFYTQ